MWYYNPRKLQRLASVGLRKFARSAPGQRRNVASMSPTAVADCISFDPEKVCGCSYLLKEPRTSQWITYWWRDVLAISIRCTFQNCHPRKMTPPSPTIGQFALCSSGLCFSSLIEMNYFVTRDRLQRMATPQSDVNAR